MFEGDSADMCAGKFPILLMGGRAEGLACAVPFHILGLVGTVVDKVWQNGLKPGQCQEDTTTHLYHSHMLVCSSGALAVSWIILRCLPTFSPVWDMVEVYLCIHNSSYSCLLFWQVEDQLTVSTACSLGQFSPSTQFEITK